MYIYIYIYVAHKLAMLVSVRYEAHSALLARGRSPR